MDGRHGRHLPSASLHQGIGEGNLARKREHERHRVVGHLVHAIVGHIGDDDLALARGGKVDIVDAEPRPSDHFAARELTNKVSGQLGVAYEQRVGVAGHGEDVGSRAACGNAETGPERTQHFLDRVERRERTVGDGDNEIAHGENSPDARGRAAKREPCRISSSTERCPPRRRRRPAIRRESCSWRRERPKPSGCRVRGRAKQGVRSSRRAP